MDCGRLIPDPDGTLCVDCKQLRIEKAKRWIGKTAKVFGVAAAVAGVAYLTNKSTSDDSSLDTENKYTYLSDESEEEEVYGLGKGNFPDCKACGSKMTIFDNWAWYTCPMCGNKVRIIDDEIIWYDEMFRQGTKEHNSDYDLADFCRGGNLSED